jgi:hypothetical protein
MGNQARHNKKPAAVKKMSQPVQNNSVQAGVTKEYFEEAFGCRVTVKNSLNILFKTPKQAVNSPYLEKYLPVRRT